MTIQLANDKKFAYLANEQITTKTKQNEEYVYNFLAETRDLQESNDILVEENESIRKKNDLIRALLGLDPQHSNVY